MFESIDSLMEFTKGIYGKTFGEIDKEARLENKNGNKGILGQVVESGFYGYKLNSNAKADFDNLGIELKVAGYIVNKKGIKKAKERLVLGRINYKTLVDEEYDFSRLIFKNRRLLIIWYEYKKAMKKRDLKVTHSSLYDLSFDETIFKRDYKIIKAKVEAGFAHRLSEGDSEVLGACTKGRNSRDLVYQPNSNIMAKKRAFCLKKQYLNRMLNAENFRYQQNEMDFVERFVEKAFEPYIGMKQIEILELLLGKKPKSIPKQINKMISDRILAKDKELKREYDLLSNRSYLIKNIPIDKDGNLLERVSFRNLRLDEFEYRWQDEECRWRRYFEENVFVLVCYEGKGRKNGERTLTRVKVIDFDKKDLEVFEESYKMVQRAIDYRDIKFLPYPKKGVELVIAPKSTKGANAYASFFHKNTTKTCFMLSKKFLGEKIKTT